MAVLANRAWMDTATTGTGTLTLGSALAGHQSFADAGIADGQTVPYTIVDGSAFEVGLGIYTSSGTTLTRVVDESSNSDNPINLSGSATVFITLTKRVAAAMVRTDIVQGFTASEKLTALANLGIGDIDLIIAQLAMGQADALNVATFLGSTGNRFADSFDALTYVDVAGATNLDTGTAGALAPGSGSAITADDPTLNANSGDNSNYGIRQVIPAAAFDTSSDGRYIRVTLSPNTTGSHPNITAVWIGHKGGSAPNFDGNQVRLKFGGNNSPSLTAGGPAVTSDWVAFNFDHTKDLVVSVDFPNFNCRCNTAATGYVFHYKGFASSDAASTTVSGYTPINDRVDLVDKIEIAPTGNLTVASTALAAASAPTAAKFMALVKEVDAITLNADFVASVSRNNGTDYTNFVLSKLYTGPGSWSVYESAELDISGQPSGTDMRCRVQTDNHKMVYIDAWDLFWRQ